MMLYKYFLTLLFFSTVSVLSFAQSNMAPDSPESIIESKSTTTEEKLAAYVQLTESLSLKNAELALEKIAAGEKLASKINDSTYIARFIFTKGAAYNTLGKRDSAAILYYQAAEIFERHKKDTDAAKVYNNIGRIFRRTDFEKAIYYYDKALEIYKKHNDQNGIATILNESGVAYEYSGNLTEAVRRYSESLAIQEKRNDKIGISYSLEFLGGTYLKQKEYKKSEEHLLKALELRKELNDSFALSISYTNIGELYKASGKNEKAIDYFNRSNAIAKKIQFLDIVSYNYNELAQVNSSIGSYKTALDHYEQHILFKDSIYGIEKTKQINELSTKYETEKNKLLIQKQQFDIVQRNFIIAGIILLLLTGVFAAYSFYRRNKAKQEARLQAAILEQQEQATKAILAAEEDERQRIARDLHDGIGQVLSAAKMNLSAYQSSAEGLTKEQKNSLENAMNLVDDSCKEIRLVSHNMMPNALLKNSLASAVRDFIDKLDKKQLQVHLYAEGLDERIDSKTESIFYRIIQECVNNVIKHSRADKLDISVIKDKDGISATIEDNGVGFNTEDKASFEGIGLKNIITRVSFLNGSVDFDSTIGKGTLVAIHIPLEE